MYVIDSARFDTMPSVLVCRHICTYYSDRLVRQGHYKSGYSSGSGYFHLVLSHTTMRLPLIGKNRSIFIGNLRLFWIHFYRIIANA